MRMAMTAVATGILCMWGASLLAGIPQEYQGTLDAAVIALHAVPADSVSEVCSSGSPIENGVACDDFEVSQQPLRSPLYVYLVVAKGNIYVGVGAMACGIEYDNALGVGLDVTGWYLCGDQQWSDAGVNGVWPSSGSGIRIIWDAASNCQETVLEPYGVHAVAGAFYVYAYSDDILKVTPNFAYGYDELLLADCTASISYSGLPGGWIGFGEYPGYNPCFGMEPPVPVKSISWGRLKRSYGASH